MSNDKKLLFSAKNVELEANGVCYDLESTGKSLHIETPVPGMFSVYNSLAAAVMVALNRAGNMRGTGKGIACFALFVASQLPIALLSLVKPKRKWDAIAHTRAVSIGEVTTRR